jgi:predicted dehydrogenase
MKIGIVGGNGAIGRRHAQNAQQLGHEVKIYDPTVVGGSGFGRERQLYDWCDAAVIATPSPYHESGLRACVERGKHVLIEKPISTAIGMLPQLLAEADDKDLTVMMGNNLRFHPGVIAAKLKQMLPERIAGEPLWANFICATQGSTTSLRDGAIFNTGAHEVDLALNLFGPAHVACASARRSETYVGVDDMADFVLVHDCGVRSTFHLDLVTPHRLRRFYFADTISTSLVDLDQRDGKTDTSYDEDYLDEMAAFGDRIDGHLVPGATGHDGLETLRVLLDIRKKAGLA